MRVHFESHLRKPVCRAFSARLITSSIGPESCAVQCAPRASFSPFASLSFAARMRRHHRKASPLVCAQENQPLAQLPCVAGSCNPPCSVKRLNRAVEPSRIPKNSISTGETNTNLRFEAPVIDYSR